MPLNWDATNVKYFQDNPDDLYINIKSDIDDYWDVNAETKSLIFGSMAIGVGNLNHDTLSDWYARWKVLERLDNFYLYYKMPEEGYEYVYLTVDVLEKHLGLFTNVSYESDKLWVARMAKSTFLGGRKYSATEIKSLLTVYRMDLEDHYLKKIKTNNNKKEVA